MKIGLTIGGYCRNDCVLCCNKGELSIPYYNLGQKESDYAAINNFMMAIKYDHLSITGGDPIYNSKLLDLLTKNRFSDTSALINPITFLVNETNERGRNISRESIDVLFDDLDSGSREISEKNKILIPLFDRLYSLSLSVGNMQSPNSWLSKAAKTYFNKYIEPKIGSKRLEFMDDLLIGYRNLDGSYSSNNSEILDKFGDYSPFSTGAFIANYIENPIFESRIRSATDFEKVRPCSDPHGVDLFFIKRGFDKPVEMNISLCCGLGYSDYLSFGTDLTLENMSKMEPSLIRHGIIDAENEFKSSAIYKMMNKSTKKKVFFEEYLSYIQDFLFDFTGNDINVLSETKLFDREDAKSCEVCYAAHRELKRANVPVIDWQNYVAERFHDNHKFRNWFNS